MSELLAAGYPVEGLEYNEERGQWESPSIKEYRDLVDMGMMPESSIEALYGEDKYQRLVMTKALQPEGYDSASRPYFAKEAVLFHTQHQQLDKGQGCCTCCGHCPDPSEDLNPAGRRASRSGGSPKVNVHKSAERHEASLMSIGGGWEEEEEVPQRRRIIRKSVPLTASQETALIALQDTAQRTIPGFALDMAADSLGNLVSQLEDQGYSRPLTPEEEHALERLRMTYNRLMWGA